MSLGSRDHPKMGVGGLAERLLITRESFLRAWSTRAATAAGNYKEPGEGEPNKERPAAAKSPRFCGPSEFLAHYATGRMRDNEGSRFFPPRIRLGEGPLGRPRARVPSSRARKLGGPEEFRPGVWENEPAR